MAEKKTVKTGTRKVVSRASPGTAAEKVAKKAAPRKTAPILAVDQLEREIRAEAQKVYENRRAKGLSGDELSDWLEAEIVVKKKYRL